MIASGVIQEVSNDLNDQEPGYEYTRWTVVQLQSYLREALGSVSDLLRDLFIKTKVVKVKSGWQQACECTAIVRVLGESDAEGNVFRYLRKLKDDDTTIWSGLVQKCADPKRYEMQDYSLSSSDEKQFSIYPPIPPTVEKFVLVECYERPDGNDLTYNLPAEAVAIVKQWMIYRALSVDSENNPTITQLADAHKKTYFELLQASMDRRERDKTNERNSNIRAVQNGSSGRAS